MNQIRFFFFLALVSIFVSSCDKVVGEGPVVTTDRTVAPFAAIDVSVPADVYYYPGSEYKVQIHAQQNITDLIESSVRGNTLQLYFNRRNVNIRSKGVRIDITAPDVNDIHISGSGNLYAPLPVNTDDFRINLSGSCNAVIDSLAANSFKTSISGSGKVEVQQGSAHTVQVDISGSGNVDLLGLEAANITTHSSGSGTIKVTATNKLEAHISGSGQVYYKGSPAVTSEISGSGSVRKME